MTLRARPDLRLRPPSETKVVQPQIIDLFKRLGFKVDPTSQYRASHIAYGFPDLVVFALPVAKMFFFEVKSYLREWTNAAGQLVKFNLYDESTWRPKPLEPDQQIFREHCRACHQLHFWGGLPEARATLVELGVAHLDQGGRFTLGRPR